MTKCIKRIRDLFEYALYKFTLYLLTLYIQEQNCQINSCRSSLDANTMRLSCDYQMSHK